MGLRSGFFRSLIVFAGLAIFLVFFVQPTSKLLSPFEVAGVILVIEIIAYALAWATARAGAIQQFVRLLVVSILESGFIVLVLVPAKNLTVDQVFIVVLTIEVAGLLIAGLFALANRKARRSGRRR